MKSEMKRKIRWFVKNLREKGRRINEFRFDDEMPLNVPRKAADETNNR